LWNKNEGLAGGLNFDGQIRTLFELPNGGASQNGAGLLDVSDSVVYQNSPHFVF
jgi:hypothetical protein